MGEQVGLVQAVLDLLYLNPLFMIGLVFVGFMVYWILRRGRQLPKMKTAAGALLLYYYLCIIFSNIVGIPTLREFQRVASLGESIFHPNLSLIPFSDGIGLGFILNIFCFIPLGFLCPMISRTYEEMKKTALLGLGVSLVIEISQLFTLYRATDTDDLIANAVGTVIGYLCFRLFVKLRIMKPYAGEKNNDPARYLPILVIAAAFLMTFVS